MRHENQKNPQKFFDFAMSHGINYFETCWFYLNFQCEQYVYSHLQKYPRNTYIIHGKMPILNVVNKFDFKEIFNSQIKIVPEHFFDRYLLQALNNQTAYWLLEKNIIPYFLEQKEKGIIKDFGLSIQCQPEILEKYLKLNCWDFIQMPLNYFDWHLCRANENYQLVQESKLPIVAQAPFKGGVLFRDKPFISEKNIEEKAINFLKKLNVETILCGTTNINHLQNIINCVNIDSQYKFNDNLIDLWKENHIINCYQCNNCIDCPQNIPIQALFELYNRALNNIINFNDYILLKESYPDLLHLCTDCNYCVEKCPSKLNIPKLLKENLFELRV